MNSYTKYAFTFFIILFGFSTKSLANFVSCKNMDNTVDVALVLSIDVSGSIDPDEMQLQMQGYINAFDDPGIRNILRESQCIAVAVVVWARFPRVIQNLVKIDSAESIKVLQKNLLDFELKRNSDNLVLGDGTMIHQGLNLAIHALINSDLNSYKKIIDVSGDGQSDNMRELRSSVQKAIQNEIEINGLPIEDTDTWSLSTEMYNELILQKHGYISMTDYYQKEVITPNGFTETATTFEDFGEAIKRKIKRELNPLLF